MDENYPSSAHGVRLSSSLSSADVPIAIIERIFGDRTETIERYADILTTTGIEWGLIGPREAERIWQRHLLNSVGVSALIDEGRDVVDIGSGAGLPGIPLAIARPDLRITLIEPLERRARFLSLVVDSLNIGDTVSVIRGRIEETAIRADRRVRESSTLTCRAVARLDKLIRWVRPLLSSAELLALKGSSAADEIADAQPLLRQLRLSAVIRTVTVDEAIEPTTIVQVEKQRPLS
ncbi:MAG: 16S rRNA (guanine(527)-N(7))-methyltransferase RsmG [Propionibacteriaceae bacterium]|jgi:16S rRNA (guanine527-N7)-methyltransferase|nr:16S rRNA (guanine(527)-N(7))-methyltransferase RsmG [Propionibacteriaceae bacterium]